MSSNQTKVRDARNSPASSNRPSGTQATVYQQPRPYQPNHNPPPPESAFFTTKDGVRLYRDDKYEHYDDMGHRVAREERDNSFTVTSVLIIMLIAALSFAVLFF